MELIAAIGGGLFVLSSLFVGGRLIWLSFKTRGLPEFMLGAGLFLMGGVGYPLMAAAVQATGLSDGARIAMLGSQMCTTIVGMSGLSWFTRHVFRPNQVWASGLMLAIIAMYIGMALAQIMGPGMMAYLAAPESGPWSGTTFAGTVVMTWAGVESLRYYGMQRKRLALGLADPVVTDRFRLWAISMLTADSITIASGIFMAMGIPIAGTAVGSALVGSLGLVTAGALSLAFVPPDFYLARVRRRAESAAQPMGS
jgi:hypothetical protein